jgi:hypothetical protein
VFVIGVGQNVVLIKSPVAEWQLALFPPKIQKSGLTSPSARYPTSGGDEGPPVATGPPHCTVCTALHCTAKKVAEQQRRYNMNNICITFIGLHKIPKIFSRISGLSKSTPSTVPLIPMICLNIFVLQFFVHKFLTDHWNEVTIATLYSG